MAAHAGRADQRLARHQARQRAIASSCRAIPAASRAAPTGIRTTPASILTETTIRQTPFNAQGTPVAFRARQAIQYGGNIDEVIQHLGTRNNGLYTNEWLIGDAKTNEIAMYELGTNHTKLWRSSKNEWFGDTPGFYWGNNNAKDLAIRLENAARPARRARIHSRTSPALRDLAWQELYQQHKGQIDEQFAFLAFRTAPLVSAHHHGRQGHHRRHGEQDDGVGRNRQAQPARMAPRRPLHLRQERRPVSQRLLPVRHARAPPAGAPGQSAARAASCRSAVVLRIAPVEGLDSPRLRRRHLVRRRLRRLPRSARVRRSREGAGRHAHHISRPETRARRTR